jgi:hypothetical protein
VWKVQLKDERIEAAVTITPKMDMALVSGYSGSVHVLNVADGQCIRSVEYAWEYYLIDTLTETLY